jgi:hypothetical protein
MLNIIPVSTLTASPFEGPETISCPICHGAFAEEAGKRRHLDQAHPDWVLKMMSRWLQSVPRENG